MNRGLDDARSRCAAWKFSGGGFRYLDQAGAHGPVKAASVRRTGNGTFQAKIVALGKLGEIDVLPPAPGLGGSMNLHLDGATPVEYCGSTEGGQVSSASTKVFKVKGAPAPGGCPLAACSPSGAFVDGTAGSL